MNIPGINNSLTTELKNSRTSDQLSESKVALSTPAPAPAAEETSTVNISEASRLAQDVQAQLASFPEVDASKVEALKLAIQSGSYEVDSNALAGKIMMLESMITSEE